MQRTSGVKPEWKPGLRLAGDRQQLAIAPEVLRPALDLFARQRDRAVVVDRLERAEALVAHVGGLGRKRRLAHMTLQSDERAHTASASLWSDSPRISPGSSRTGAGTIAARSRAMATRSPSAATAVASPPAPWPVNVISPAYDAGDDRGVLRPGRPREQRGRRHEGRRDPGRRGSIDRGSYSACAICRMVPPRCRAFRKSSGCELRRAARLDLAGADAQAERERAQDRQLRGRIAAVEIGRRIGLGVAARAGIGDRLVDRAARRVHVRQHGIAGAVQDRVDARDPLAGEAVAQRANDRHRAADRRLEAQLPPLPLGERQQRVTVVRDDLLVRRDHRFAGEQRAADVVDGRLGADDRFDDDVDVAGEQVVEPVGPGQTAGERLGLPRALLACAPIADVGELEVRRRVGAGETPGDGGPDGAEAENADATARRRQVARVARAVSRGLERVQPHDARGYQSPEIVRKNFYHTSTSWIRNR